MKSDVYWQTFTETGDPIYYMLHKAVQEIENRSGQAP